MGSKARESAEAMSLAFVLLDFQHAGVRRRASVNRRDVLKSMLTLLIAHSKTYKPFHSQQQKGTGLKKIKKQKATLVGRPSCSSSPLKKKSETRKTASVLKQDPNTSNVQKNAIY